MNAVFLNEYRCKCGKLLLKGIFFDGALEIKCKHCGQFNNFGTINRPDNATHYSLMVNDKGMISNVSDSACRILGFTASELVGQSFSLINPQLPQGIFRKLFNQESVSTDNNNFQLNTIHLSKSGREIPVFVYLKQYQPNDNEKNVLVVVEVRDSSSNFKEASTHLVDACDFFFDIDKDGTELFISPTAEKIFGYSSQDILGNSYFDYLPIAKIVEIKLTLNRHTASGLPFRILHDITKSPGGKTIRNDLYFSPTMDNSGNIVGYRIFGWRIKPSKTGK